MPGRSTVSLRWSLLRSFILLILLSSMIVLGLMWFGARETERALSSRLIARGAVESREALDGFLGPAEVGTRMGMAWGRAGLLSLDVVTSGEPDTDPASRRAEARRLNGLLLPFLLEKPALSSAQVATSAGQGFLVLLLPDGTIRNRVVNRDGWGLRTLWFDLDRDGVPIRSEWKEVDYEPRKRSWYEAAVQAEGGQVAWTDPYTFYTTKDLGITASGWWPRDTNDETARGVIAYDVLLTDLTRFTQSAERISPNAMRMITTANWDALGLPDAPAVRNVESVKSLFLQPANTLGVPEVDAAIAAATERRNAGEQVFAFQHDGNGWWGGIDTVPLGRHRQIRTLVLVPDRDLLEDVSQQRRYLLIATVVTLLAALLYSLMLARIYSRPLEELAAQSTLIGRLDFRQEIAINAPLREIQTLAQAQEQSVAALKSFSRYVPVDVVRELVSAGEVARIGGRTEHLTVLFTDIAGFTTLAEQMRPQTLADHMAEYFEEMIAAIEAEGGTVDKFVGDAIVAFWGAPRPLDDHVARGVRAVLGCQARLCERNAKWVADGLPPLPTRFGLASGPVVVGNIGAPSRLAYTVLGDTVNFASRLEALNKPYGTNVLADDLVREGAGRRFLWRRVDVVVVKGRNEESRVHELLGETDGVPEPVREMVGRYETAWDLYSDQQFADAAATLEALLADVPGDGPSQRLLGRCREYQQSPPDRDWSSATRMKSK